MTNPLASIAASALIADELLAGGDRIASEVIFLAAGQDLPAGAVLGQVALTEEWVLSEAAAVDGSQVPKAILVEACSAGPTPAPAMAYTRGDFVAQRLTLGSGHTLASITEGLADRGIALIT